MEAEQIKLFCTGISTFAWNADFYKFCEVCGFTVDTEYAKDKWKQWQELQRGLNAFDQEKLKAIIDAGLSKG